MTTSPEFSPAQDERLLALLQRLLAIRSSTMRPTLDEASTLIAEAFNADKVDIFLYEPRSESLVALGTSRTPMGERQRALGLDRLPLSNGGRAAWTFHTGDPYVTGRADEDPEEVRGLVEGLGIRSVMNFPLDIDGERRGILQVDSATPDFFTADDVKALAPVAGWTSLILHRAELIEQQTSAAHQRGREQAGEELARITRRQQEVAICLAEGLSNAEIAQRLTLTEGTVANHIEAILRRLNFRSRTQVAVWAVERGLYRMGRDDHAAEELSERRRWPGRSVGGTGDADGPHDTSLE
jgi:DNA-binding CsgD family transcriptional regulator